MRISVFIMGTQRSYIVKKKNIYKNITASPFFKKENICFIYSFKELQNREKRRSYSRKSVSSSIYIFQYIIGIIEFSKCAPRNGILQA